jgi:hypothetical protein
MYKLSAIGVTLTLAVMILTIISYAEDYGMFRYHGGSAFGLASSNIYIGFFHEKAVGGGVTESTTDFNCYTDSSDQCKSEYGHSARKAAVTAVTFSVVSFVWSFVFIPVFVGISLRMFALCQIILQVIYIISNIVAYVRLRQYFQYSLDISYSNIDIDDYGRCWIAAVVLMCLALVFTILGPCIGLCVEADSTPRTGFWRV